MKYIIFIIFWILIFYLIINKPKEHFKNTYKLKPIKDTGLKDKVIIITGSTKGIGYQLAKTLSRYECKLVINGRKQENVDKVVAELSKNNDNIFGVGADLSNEEEIYKLFNAVVKKFKKIDILINNAAFLKGRRDLTRKSYQDWKSELAVNIDSVFLLSQKVISHMRSNSIRGRIINISSRAAKLKDTNTRSGTHILTKSMVERFSDILADENYSFRIAVTTIRIDEDIGTSSINFLPFELPNQIKALTKNVGSITSFISAKPSKIMPVFLYVLKAPFHEISGKLISTSTFLANPNLSKIIPAHQLELNDKLFKTIKVNKPITKNTNPNIKYLVKQNPYGPSPKVIKLIQNRKFKFNKYNAPANYKGSLNKVLAKKIGVNKNQITFFRTEHDAIRKIIDLFVTNYGEIIVIYPSWSYIFIVANERKITMKYTVLKEVSKTELQPNFYYIFRFITAKTKLIYLSSPNTVTGQSIITKDFEAFLKKIPGNIPILIDQRFHDFSYNTKCLNPIKYLKQNVISLRSFNNFYGIENLELAYIIADQSISNILQQSQVFDNPMDQFNESLALTVFNDTQHNQKIKQFIRKEKERIYRKLDDRNIKYFPSETNYLLVETHKPKEQLLKHLEKQDIVLYKSDDYYNSFWTLPISDKETNKEVIDIITSYNG